MITGMMNHLQNKNILYIVLIFCFSAPINALELPELLQLFAQKKESTVDFTEETHAFFLDEPIKSSGRLQYSYPNKLYKFILEPEIITQKINGDELIITNGNETHNINLTDRPEFTIILRALMYLLSGNQAALNKDFKIIFKDNITTWDLLLAPHDSYLSSHVESIKIVGYKEKISSIVITEPNNDRSITHLYNHR